MLIPCCRRRLEAVLMALIILLLIATTFNLRRSSFLCDMGKEENKILEDADDVKDPTNPNVQIWDTAEPRHYHTKSTVVALEYRIDRSAVPITASKDTGS